MRYRVDRSWSRFGNRGEVVLAGSPYRIFRLTGAGSAVAVRIEAGDDVAGSALVDRLLDAGAIHPALVDRSHRLSVDDVTVVTPQLGGAVRADGRVTVDDGSEPSLDGVTIRLPENRGPAAARNAGRRHVTTPLIAFVDADVELLEVEAATHGGRSWLDALVAHFDDARVGLVAPRILGEPGTSLDLGDDAARIRAGTRVSYVPAAAVVIRAEAFDDVGGFDETLRFGEDVDLVWRLDGAGWRCRYEPGSVVWHRPRRTLGGRLRQQVGYGSSAAPLAERHPRALAPFRSNGWTAAVWALLGAGQPVIAVGLATGSALALIRKLPDVPARVAFGLAMKGHARAGQQLAAAIRRAWWPLAVLACVVSRRARWIASAAVVADIGAMPNDVAYGWGMWREMFRRRVWRPIVPEISPWPPARDRRR